MKSGHIAMIFIVLLKSVPVCFAIYFAGQLALVGLRGWGWFLFIALCLGVSSIKLD